jgi:hypothetical protein
MRSRTWTYMSVVTMFAALRIPVRRAAQDQPAVQDENEREAT